jgi:hypothetical protein
MKRHNNETNDHTGFTPHELDEILNQLEKEVHHITEIAS